MLTGEQLTKTHLVIATPCYGGQVFQNYFMSIIKLIFLTNQAQIPISFLVRGGDSLIPRIRNSIVAEVLANKSFTHLLWIDADIGFDPAAVIRLLGADLDVACGLYPLKKLVWPDELPQGMSRAQFEAIYTHYPYNPVPDAKIDAEGFIEVLDAPTGFMMIKREVLEKMCDAYPGLKYTPDHMLGMEGIKDAIHDHHYRLFDVMTEENGRYLSEDYAFCRRWQNIGGKIHIDATSNLSHQGGHMYTGNFLESLKARHMQHAERLPEDVATLNRNQ
jgi:hypothetical protein